MSPQRVQTWRPEMRGPDLLSPLPRRTWSLFQREGERPCGEQLPATLTWALGTSLQDKSQRPLSPTRWLLSCPQPRPVGEAGAPRRMGKKILPLACAWRWGLFTHDSLCASQEGRSSQESGLGRRCRAQGRAHCCPRLLAWPQVRRGARDCGRLLLFLIFRDWKPGLDQPPH